MKNKVDHLELPDFVIDFAKLLPRLDALREGIDLYGATTFSEFAIFNPDENTLSRVLAELFDPAGSHGQGLLFLNGLLAAIGKPRLNRQDAVKVRRESVTRAKRRIDIVIETSQYVIGIENKPWAAQQPKQLEDYLMELRADLHGRKPVLIFLSDQVPNSGGNEVIRIPYYGSDEAGQTLHGILLNVVRDIKAGAPKIFVEDFIRYIEINFGDEYVDTPSDKPYKDAVHAEFDDLSKRRAIATVLLSQEDLHSRILDEIGDYILEEVRNRVNVDFEPHCDRPEIEAKLSHCLWARYAPFGLRRPRWPTNCLVALEAQSATRLSDIQFGVKAPDGIKIASHEQSFACSGRKALENMVTTIPGGKKNIWWAWHQELPEPYWGPEFAARVILNSPTGSVKDHSEVQDVARKFVKMAAEVDRLLTMG